MDEAKPKTPTTQEPPSAAAAERRAECARALRDAFASHPDGLILVTIKGEEINGQVVPPIKGVGLLMGQKMIDGAIDQWVRNQLRSAQPPRSDAQALSEDVRKAARVGEVANGAGAPQ